MIYTARAENNKGFFRDILRLYVPEGSAIADLTWGRGNFWVGIDQSRYKLIRLDKYTPCDVKADFRAVPLADESQDAVVFDPPYVTRMGFKKRSKQNPNGSNQKFAFGLDASGPKNEREIDELYAGVQQQREAVETLYGDANESRSAKPTGNQNSIPGPPIEPARSVGPFI